MSSKSAPKRASTRTVVVSKSMRRVDETTRNEVRDRRLTMLESDNHVEAEQSAGDDAYGDDDGNDQHKRKKTKLSSKASGGLSLSKWATRRIKSLEKVILDEGYDQAKGDGDLFAMDASACIEQCGRYPNYISINAGQSDKPARKFCSVCGHQGQYSCTRCGMRYCSIKCNNHHKETRCMKFSLF
jgi:zinc finger HIT domain-containing protein 1